MLDQYRRDLTPLLSKMSTQSNSQSGFLSVLPGFFVIIRII